MTKHDNPTVLSRRAVLMGAGALVVSVGAPVGFELLTGMNEAFAQGALASIGGRLLICLPASARRGQVSRIVPALDEQALCTLPRYLTDAVVTEHGVAELRGLSLDARAQALIAIAAPEHRGRLSSAWDSIRRNA